MRAVLIGSLVLLASACGGWQKTSAEAVYKTALGLETVYKHSRPFFHRRCLAIAKKCRAIPCADLEVCKAQSAKFNTGLKIAAASVDAGRGVVVTAIAVDGAKGWKEKAIAAGVKALQELANVYKHARSLGLLK